VSWFKSPSTPSSGVPDDFASLIRESIADGDNDSASRCAAFCESDGGDVVCVTFHTFQGVNELVDHGPPGSYTDSVTPPSPRPDTHTPVRRCRRRNAAAGSTPSAE